MKLFDIQKKILLDKHRFKVVCAGRRAGKTDMISEDMGYFMLQKLPDSRKNKPIRILYSALTYSNAFEIMWDRFCNRWESAIKNRNKSDLTIEFFNGAKLRMTGFESIENAVGNYIDKYYADETALYTHFRFGWENVIRPTLADNQGSAMFLSSPRGMNFFRDLYMKEMFDDDWKSFHFTAYDNPFILNSEIDSAKKDMTEKAFNQEYLAEFVVRENLVLNEFDRKRHIKERPNNISIKKQIAGVDFGFAHPTAIIYLSICYDGNIYADTEYVAKGITNTDVIRILKDSDPDEIWPDIAEPQRIEEMKQSNLKVFDNYKKDVEKQFDNINTLFKQDKLFISKRCLCLIDEIESYSYLEDKSGRPLETLPKSGDDCLAALRYALSNYNPINLEYKMKNDINLDFFNDIDYNLDKIDPKTGYIK